MKGADLIKFLMSLVVMWIHTGTNDLWGITKIAVPIFFTLSGFFLFGKILKVRIVGGATTEVVLTWLRKTLTLYLTWTVIYIPFAVIGFAQDGLPVWKSALVYIRNVTLVGENYLSWPLWYLLGLLQAGVIVWICEKCRMPLRMYLVIALALALAPRLLNLESSHAYLSLFKSTRNGFFHGFHFMVIGGLIRYIFPGIKGWKPGAIWYRPALTLRFFSIHIYLTHMLWAGLLMLTIGMEKGLLLWGISVCAALATGTLVLQSDKVQKALYGIVYV